MVEQKSERRPLYKTAVGKLLYVQRRTGHLLQCERTRHEILWVPRRDDDMNVKRNRL